MNNYDQIIYITARKAGFTPTGAKLVVAQARLESDNYKSRVFQNNLNTSGMKFIGQPLATRGTIAPLSERSASCRRGEVCVNSDYYAKFKNVGDSASDKINRLYEINMGGVTPQQLKNVKTPEEFANLLKKRRYYGADESQYASGLKARLKLVDIDETLAEKELKSEKYTNYATYGLIIIGVTALSYYMYKKYYK
jgi:hypothetical protein